MSRPRKDAGPYGGVSTQDENFKHMRDNSEEIALIKARLDALEDAAGLPRGEDDIYRHPRPWNGSGD